MDVTIPCVCDPTAEGPRHESDTVTLKDKLTDLEGTTITKATTWADSDDEQVRAVQILAILSEFYVLVGVGGWTVRDRSNKPVPVTHGAIRARILGNPNAAAIVHEKADELYQETVLLPLLRRASNSSPPSQTDAPTSAKPSGESAKRPKRSKPSSITTIPTDDTATTSSSLDGDSTFSQSSVSAA